MATTCSRCGRGRRADELIGPGISLGNLRPREALQGGPLLGEKVWAQLDGEDVCPDCLTIGEERELARSYVELVEREIARLTASGEDPDSIEAPLVAYA